MRPISADQLRASGAARRDLFRVSWEPATGSPSSDELTVVEVAEGDVHEVTTAALARVQDWLAGEHAGRLVFVTRGAVAKIEEMFA